MRTVFLIAAAAALAAASPAQAQHHGGGRWVSQYDRPGDYRCDAYWDANDRDCAAGWRDQRRYASQGYGYGHRPYGRHGHGRRYESGSVHHGAYGRPDIVYAGGEAGYGQAHGQAGGRDPGRIDWCRRNYRSYDPSSGYYRAYSGRLIWCG